MPAIFIAMFLSIYLFCRWIYEETKVPDYYKPYISKDGTGTRKIPTTESVRAWQVSVSDFRREYDFLNQIRGDRAYRSRKIAEFNELLHSLPGGENLRYNEFQVNDKTRYHLLAIVEMAHYGKIFSHGNYYERIHSLLFVQAVTPEPEWETVVAFFKWLEEELIRNGRHDARILAEFSRSSGMRYPGYMFWQEGTRFFGQSRLW